MKISCFVRWLHQRHRLVIILVMLWCCSSFHVVDALHPLHLWQTEQTLFFIIIVFDICIRTLNMVAFPCSLVHFNFLNARDIAKEKVLSRFFLLLYEEGRREEKKMWNDADTIPLCTHVKIKLWMSSIEHRYHHYRHHHRRPPLTTKKGFRSEINWNACSPRLFLMGKGVK